MIIELYILSVMDAEMGEIRDGLYRVGKCPNSWGLILDLEIFGDEISPSLLGDVVYTSIYQKLGMASACEATSYCN